MDFFFFFFWGGFHTPVPHIWEGGGGTALRLGVWRVPQNGGFFCPKCRALGGTPRIAAVQPPLPLLGGISPSKMFGGAQNKRGEATPTSRHSPRTRHQRIPRAKPASGLGTPPALGYQEPPKPFLGWGVASPAPPPPQKKRGHKAAGAGARAGGMVGTGRRAPPLMRAVIIPN